MMENKDADLPKNTESLIARQIQQSFYAGFMQDWGRQFPGLTPHPASQKLLKTIGPLLFGIELEMYGHDAYKPRLVAYNLIDSAGVRPSFIIHQSITDSQGAAITIAFGEHAVKHIAVCKLLHEQAPISLHDEPDIQGIITGLIGYVGNCVPDNPFLPCQAVMQFSRLLDQEGGSDHYFDQAVSLLKSKMPDAELDVLTRGTNDWVKDIKHLTLQTIGQRMQESKDRYRF